MRFHHWNTHFRLEHSVRQNRTTFPDVTGWSRKFSANTTQKFVFSVLFSISPWGRSHLSNHVVRRGSTKTLNSNSPPQLEMVRNGPQSLDANDVMVNARGLPGGDVEDSNGPFPSFPGLCFKTRVGAQPLIWKSFFILLQMKLIFTRKIVHVASFWKWGFLELGSGLLIGALQAGRQSERGTGPELRVGAHYRNRKWEAKDFEKVYTVVCGTPNYLFIFFGGGTSSTRRRIH